VSDLPDVTEEMLQRWAALATDIGKTISAMTRGGEMAQAVLALVREVRVGRKALELASRWQAGNEAIGTEVLCENCEKMCCDCQLADRYLPGAMDYYRASARAALAAEEAAR